VISSDNSQPRLTVALATYNGREMLEVALASLSAQTFRAYRTVVVDDASTDDTLEWLAEHWPDVQVVVHPANKGATATLNDGLRAADSDMVMLLNNDMELDPHCLQELVAELDAHPEAAAVAPKLLAFHDREILDGAGDVFEWTGEASRRGQGERDVGQYDEPQAVFGACGGAALYRRAALNAVGLFDEDFFANQDDVDWSFRAQLLGFSSRYAPLAVAYHIGSATLGKGQSDFAMYQNWRNQIWVVFKNYPLAALMRHAPQLVASQLHNLVWTIQTRRVSLFLRVWRDALRGMPATLRKRRAVQRSRTIGTRELEARIGADEREAKGGTATSP
jgi:GT2 family glycosyltransferase